MPDAQICRVIVTVNCLGSRSRREFRRVVEAGGLKVTIVQSFGIQKDSRWKKAVAERGVAALTEEGFGDGYPSSVTYLVEGPKESLEYLVWRSWVRRWEDLVVVSPGRVAKVGRLRNR